MKIAVTGANGFIGSRVRDVLEEAGHQTVSIDVYPFPGQPSAAFQPCDVRDRQTLAERMRGCEAVFHLAAAHFDFGISPATFHAVNVHGMENICSVATELQIHDICFYSSVAVFGDAPGPLTEDTLPRPDSDYGRSKLAAEAVLKSWVETSPTNQALVMRPTATLGPWNYANMYSLIRQIDSGKYVQVGRGQNIKSLSYVENLIAATLFAWKRQQRQRWEIYNYVEKPDMTSRQIAATVYKAMGKKPPAWILPYPLARLVALPLDIVIAITGKNLPVSGARIRKFSRVTTLFESKRIRDIGFQPEHSLEDGIKAMVQWYQKEGKTLPHVKHLPDENIVRP